MSAVAHVLASGLAAAQAATDRRDMSATAAARVVQRLETAGSSSLRAVEGLPVNPGNPAPARPGLVLAPRYSG